MLCAVQKSPGSFQILLSDCVLVAIVPQQSMRSLGSIRTHDAASFVWYSKNVETFGGVIPVLFSLDRLRPVSVTCGDAARAGVPHQPIFLVDP
jgi:hypothetical protein